MTTVAGTATYYTGYRYRYGSGFGSRLFVWASLEPFFWIVLIFTLVHDICIPTKFTLYWHNIWILIIKLITPRWKIWARKSLNTFWFFFAGELHQDPDGAPCVPPGLCHGPHLQDWRTREVRWDTYSQCADPGGCFSRFPDPDFYPSRIPAPTRPTAKYLVLAFFVTKNFTKWKLFLFLFLTGTGIVP